MHVIRFIENAAGLPEATKPGAYLKRYNPEGRDGFGDIEWSEKAEEALRFLTFGEALAQLRIQPHARPWRPDGRPNRPLTAYTVSIEELKA